MIQTSVQHCISQCPFPEAKPHSLMQDAVTNQVVIMIYHTADCGPKIEILCDLAPEDVIFLLNGLSSAEMPIHSLALEIHDQHHQPVLSILLQ